MRIAVLSHLRHPVARPFMGGMEAHSWHLVRGLVARGHDVTLFASGDSDPQGAELVPVLPRHYDADYPWGDFHGTEALNTYQDEAIAAILPRLRAFDVVHNNTLHRYPPRLARRDRVAMVSSMHVPPFPALRDAVQDAPAPWSLITTCSHKQVGAWWPDGAPRAARVVPNGIDMADWPFVARGDGSAAWAGRITPNKGPHLALEAARIADVPLTLYGAIEDQGYFDRALRPLLDDERRYGGHLSGADLARDIGRASVLLFTPLWDEPFGLVAIEAMACGLPVAATDMGAVREVVGEAGRFAPPDDPGALAAALRAAMTIPRRLPHDRVARHFSLERMLTGYEALYAEAQRSVTAPFPPAPDFGPRLLPPAAVALPPKLAAE